MQIIYFIYQLHFKLFKLPIVTKFIIPFPVIQLGKHFFQIRTYLFFGKVFIYHILYTHINQFIHIIICVRSICIAPFTILLI